MSDDKGTIKIEFGQLFERLILGIFIAEIIMIFLHVVVVWWPDNYPEGLYYMVHLSREGNFPTWFSSTQWFLLGLTSFLIYAAEKIRLPDKRTNVIWLLAGCGAVFLSADEASTIHENFGDILSAFIDAADEGSALWSVGYFPSYYWAIIYAPFAIPAAVFLAWFFWREFDQLRSLPIIGMILFLTGAVLLDYIEGAYGDDELGAFEFEITAFDLGWLIDIHLFEEALELFGVTLVLMGCLLHAARLLRRFSISLSNS